MTTASGSDMPSPTVTTASGSDMPSPTVTTPTLLPLVHYAWILLSLLLAGTCTFCLLQPEWFVHPDFIHSFGVYTVCVRDVRIAARDKQRCGFYGGRFGLGNVPSAPWQAACVLYGGGCVLLCLGAVLSLATGCIRTSWETSFILITKDLQIAAVFLLALGLLVYPIGLESPYFRYYCGDVADVFRSGRCEVGWTYMLAIAATALSIFCPILSHLSVQRPQELYDIKYIL